MTMVGCVAQEESTPRTQRSLETGASVTTSVVTEETPSTTESTAETTVTTETTVSTSATTRTTEPSVTTTKAAPVTVTTTKRASTATTKKTTTTTTTKKTTATTTTKKTTTTTKPQETVDLHAIGEYMTTLINRERAAAGVAPVAHRADLQSYASLRAAEIKEQFSHTRPDGTDCFTVFGDRFFWAMGENIAMGQRTIEEVMEDWMNSPGHRENILSEDFNGVAVGFDDNHWVQLFVKE